MDNKKYFFVIALLLTFVIYLSRCSDTFETDKADCVKPDSIINPNGSSELSVLMRQMHDKAAEMKLLIEQGKQIGSIPEEFQKINTAAPTDSQTKKTTYDAFAQNYLVALKTVYQAEEGMVQEKYNGMVNACLSCHSDHCPGPVPKIKKLLIF